MNERKVIQTPMAEVYLEDGIIFMAFTHVDVTLEIAKAHVAVMHENFAHLFPLPVVVDTSKMRNVSKETRDFWASPENSQHTSCSAVLIQSAIARIAGNLYLQFNKPKYPTKLFTDKEKAVEWIRQTLKRS